MQKTKNARKKKRLGRKDQTKSKKTHLILAPQAEALQPFLTNYYRFIPEIAALAGRSAPDIIGLSIITHSYREDFAIDKNKLRLVLAEVLKMSGRRGQNAVSRTIKRLGSKGLITEGWRTSKAGNRHKTLRPAKVVAGKYARAVENGLFVNIYLDQLAHIMPAIKRRLGGCLKDWLAITHLTKRQKRQKRQPSVRQINAVSGDKGYIRRASILRAAGILEGGRSRRLIINLSQMVSKRWKDRMGVGVSKLFLKPDPPDPGWDRQRQKIPEEERRNRELAKVSEPRRQKNIRKIEDVKKHLGAAFGV